MATTLTGMLAALPGLALVLAVTQQDPVRGARPGDTAVMEVLDYIPTARVTVDKSFDDYWAARGKNLRQNVRKLVAKLLGTWNPWAHGNRSWERRDCRRYRRVRADRKPELEIGGRNCDRGTQPAGGILSAHARRVRRAWQGEIFGIASTGRSRRWICASRTMVFSWC